MVHGHRGNIHLYLDTVFSALDPGEESCYYKKVTGREPSECVLRLQIIDFSHTRQDPEQVLFLQSAGSVVDVFGNSTLECNHSLLDFIQDLLGGVLTDIEGKTQGSQWSLKS